MKIIEFQKIHALPQLPAASAIVCFGQKLFLIGDSSQYLHRIDEAGSYCRFPLLPDTDPAMEPLAKKQKADFESLMLDSARTALLVLPSGSKENRCLGMEVSLSKAGDTGNECHVTRRIDFAPLFSRVMEYARIDAEDFNIEGGGPRGEGHWFLLNRGNGPQARNLLVLLEGSDLPASQPVAQYPLDLPVLKGESGNEGEGVKASVTDGCIIGNSLYVVAAAEAGTSTYSDGEVNGSLIARYDLENFALQAWCLLPGRMKFEGISALEEPAAPHELSLLLCADNDDPTQAGAVYRICLSKGDVA